MPTLKPGVDYVRAYQDLYGVTLRLGIEYAALPDTGSGGINGNSKDSDYGLGLRNLCGDSGAIDIPGKCAVLQDLGSMTIPGTDDYLPGTFFTALQQVNDGDAISEWATNEHNKLVQLFSLFSFTYSGPGNQ